MVDISVFSTVKENTKFDISCYVLDRITKNMPHYTLIRENISIPPCCMLADPDFNVPGQIDILLGADVYYSIVHGIPAQIPRNSLYMVETHLGYIISGPIPVDGLNYCTTLSSSAKSPCRAENACHLIHGSNLEKLFERFWSVEHVSDLNKRTLSPEESLAEEIFSTSITHLENGYLQVDLPLKTPNAHLQLGISYNQTLKRFENLEKRFAKNPNLLSRYKQFIDEYISLGHGKYVALSQKNELNENKYFIPHHCVIREDSLTTKLRVVFDASMKSSNGVSLNNIMLKGFPVQPDLYDILCRFRSFPYVFVGDIEKMYRQIKVNPTQTFLQNILWRDHPAAPLRCIELQTVSYGTNSAPYLATRSLNYLADTHKERYPLAAQIIHNQCYVDDILYGCDTLTELTNTYSELTKLLGTAQFKLHKCSSNSNTFIKVLQNASPQDVFELKEHGSPNRVLGICWNSKSDLFSISLPKPGPELPPTKRRVLSTIAQLFDPLGLVGPIVVSAKIIMQQIWVSKIDWDQELPNDILVRWSEFQRDMPNLSKLTIPRYLFRDQHFVRLELHGFADASLKINFVKKQSGSTKNTQFAKVGAMCSPFAVTSSRKNCLNI
ncbi:uncharacterized protein LOC125505138 [Dendroctonus ponderosae]|uniref:uncharacterized protein LOC125505138 n=1 Tax=Dendroctonus ponderosae TaxID=77166 RepID=UPI00203600B0|nr:uncharacterized protein LOC125505138 [Dendroctonus ponderosae]